MESAPATPKTYNRMHPTGRPAWFSATICSVKEYGTIRYAGEEIKDNLYNVFCWHGRHEVVPEAFLMAHPVDVDAIHHSAGRVVPNSGLVGIGGRKINTTLS